MDGHRFGTLRYRRFHGDLFVGRVSGLDVGQGDLGDCYFLSSLVAVANLYPSFIRRAIEDHRDGTYTVTFRTRVRGRVAPVPVRVDSRFPVNARGAQVFGKGLRNGRHGQELWPALFEKAFAAWQHGYLSINEGGFGGAALTSLTGAASRTRTPNRYSEQRLWRILTEAERARRPLLSSTPDAAALARRTGRSDGAGLIEDHFYALLGTRVRKGKRFVRLYTPLVDFTAQVVSTPRASDNAKRFIHVPFALYRRAFDELVVGGAPVE